MFARRIVGGGADMCHQRSDSGPCADHIRITQTGSGKEVIGRTQEVLHVTTVRADRIRSGFRRCFGRANDRMHRRWQNEEHTSIIRMQQRQRIDARHTISRHRDVNALAAEYRFVCDAVIESTCDVAPGTGCVDDHPRTNIDRCTGHAILHAYGGELSIGSVHELHHCCVIQRHRSRLGRRQHVGDCQPHIVGACVPVLRAADQSVGAERPLLSVDLGARHTAMLANIPEQRQRIVCHQPCAKFPARNARPSIHGPGESQRPHQVRCNCEQRSTLAAGFEHEVKVTMFEIAHTAMHQT